MSRDNVNRDNLIIYCTAKKYKGSVRGLLLGRVHSLVNAAFVLCAVSAMAPVTVSRFALSEELSHASCRSQRLH